ncbi:hypothetical protein [Pseudomonas sp. 3A(2025)]
MLLQDHGFSEPHRVSEMLERRLAKLDRARLRIEQVRRQADLYRLDLSKYQIAPALHNIESIYREYDSLIARLLAGIREQAAGGLQGAADRVLALGRLGCLASRIVSEVGADLKKLQMLLSNNYRQYFLEDFFQDQSRRDFVSFFYAMKFSYVRFYLAQVKAQFLLRMVDRDPCTPFRLTRELENFQTELEKQQREFTHWLPEQVENLLLELAQEHQGMAGGAAVSLHSALEGEGFRPDGNKGTYMTEQLQEWRLEPIEPLILNPHIDHRFRLKHAVSGLILQPGGEGTHTIKDWKEADGGWKVTWNHRFKVFNLQFKGRENDPSHDLRLISHSARQGAPRRLDGKRAATPYDEVQQFHIDVYSSAVRTRQQLLVDEHLTPDSYLKSEGDIYRLYYRYDGAVQLVRTADNKVVWAAADREKVRAGRLMLQPDGHFVAYDHEGRAYWATGKYFKDEQQVYKKSVLKVRKDGRVAIGLQGKEAFWLSPA